MINDTVIHAIVINAIVINATVINDQCCCVCYSVKAGTCWVNCHNMFDAASGFGGYRESGFGRDGGKEVV